MHMSNFCMQILKSDFIIVLKMLHSEHFSHLAGFHAFCIHEQRTPKALQNRALHQVNFAGDSAKSTCGNF